MTLRPARRGTRYVQVACRVILERNACEQCVLLQLSGEQAEEYRLKPGDIIAVACKGLQVAEDGSQ